MITFASPWVFLLLPLPFLVRWLTPSFRDSATAVRVPHFDMVQEASGATPSTGSVVRSPHLWQRILFVVFWMAIVTSMARPQLLEEAVIREIPTRDLLLLVDLSGSMETKDFKNADGEPVERLDAVKEVLDDFLTRRKGDRVGMIVFGNAAFVQTPFTQDLEVCRQLLNETAVRMAGPKTAFGDAIGLAINLFERSDIEDQVIIALTDGNDTGSKIPPDEAARIAAGRGVVIHTVAIGDPEAAGEEKLDEKALEAVAKSTGGSYFFGADRKALEGIYTEIDKLGAKEVATTSHRPRRELFHWPLGLVILASLVAHGIRLAIQRSLVPTHSNTTAG